MVPGLGRLGRPRAGFTLVELIVVVTLLTVMVAAVAPVYRGAVRNGRHDQAVRSLVSTLRYAQERAVTDTAEYRVYLDPDKETYWVMREAKRVGQEKEFEPAAEPYAQGRKLPEGLELTRPRAQRDRKLDAYYIAFYPQGACDAATVRLRADEHDRITIRTKGMVGQFEVDGP